VNKRMASMNRWRWLAAWLVLGLLCQAGCAGTSGNTLEERQASMLKVRDETLEELYVREPGTKETIKTSSGYAVVKAFSLHLGIISLAGGSIVIVDNTTGKPIFDKFFRFMVGPGLAAKSLRAVLLIKDAETMERLSDTPWLFAALLEASFRFGSFGGSLADATSFGDNVNAYYWTKNGVALEAAIGFGKTWRAKDLNAQPTSSQ